MKLLSVGVFICSSVAATGVLAECKQNENNLFHCEASRAGKVMDIQVCETERFLRYVFSEKTGGVHLSAVVPRRALQLDASASAYTIDVSGADTDHRVFWRKTYEGKKVEAGVHIMRDEQLLETIHCQVMSVKNDFKPAEFMN